MLPCHAASGLDVGHLSRRRCIQRPVHTIWIIGLCCIQYKSSKATCDLYARTQLLGVRLIRESDLYASIYGTPKLISTFPIDTNQLPFTIDKCQWQWWLARSILSIALFQICSCDLYTWLTDAAVVGWSCRCCVVGCLRLDGLTAGSHDDAVGKVTAKHKARLLVGGVSGRTSHHSGCARGNRLQPHTSHVG